jgi:hypothetical protein
MEQPMPAFIVIGTYGPYEDCRFQRPTEALRVTLFDEGDAAEEAHEWLMSDPTCRSRVVPVPLCHDAETY